MTDEEIEKKHVEIREGIRAVTKLTDEIAAMVPDMDERDKQYAAGHLQEYLAMIDEILLVAEEIKSKGEADG